MCEGDKRFNYWIGSLSLRSLCEIVWNNSLQIYSWNVSSLCIFSLFSHKLRDGFFSKCIYLVRSWKLFLSYFLFFFFKSTLMLVSFEKECTNHFQNQTNLLVSVFLQHIFFSSRWILSLFSFLLFFSLSFYPCLPLFLCPYLSLFVSIQHIYYVNTLFQTMESILDILIIFDVKNKILSIECIFNLYNNDMKSVLLLVPLKNETEFESIV